MLIELTTCCGSNQFLQIQRIPSRVFDQLGTDVRRNPLPGAAKMSFSLAFFDTGLSTTSRNPQPSPQTGKSLVDLWPSKRQNQNRLLRKFLRTVARSLTESASDQWRSSSTRNWFLGAHPG